MKTMTHSKKQKRDWHAGKARLKETTVAAQIRSIRKGNFRGAATDRRTKNGILYKAL